MIFALSTNGKSYVNYRLTVMHSGIAKLEQVARPKGA